MLNAVYQLDDLQRDIDRMTVTHPTRQKIHWSIEIKRPPTDPIQMPVPTTPPAPASAKDRARVKSKPRGRKNSSAQ